MPCEGQYIGEQKTILMYPSDGNDLKSSAMKICVNVGLSLCLAVFSLLRPWNTDIDGNYTTIVCFKLL